MTHRIEPLFKNHFSIWLKVLNSSNNSKNSTLFLNTTQRVAPFFFEYDAKNWTLFWIDAKNWTLYEHDSKELNLFLTMIQRIESLSEYDSKNRTFFFEYDSMNRTHFFECDSKNWNFGWKNCQKNQNGFFTWLEESDPLFSIWLKELNLFRFDSKI